jgi:hypothetical protein
MLHASKQVSEFLACLRDLHTPCRCTWIEDRQRPHAIPSDCTRCHATHCIASTVYIKAICECQRHRKTTVAFCAMATRRPGPRRYATSLSAPTRLLIYTRFHPYTYDTPTVWTSLLDFVTRAATALQTVLWSHMKRSAHIVATSDAVAETGDT